MSSSKQLVDIGSHVVTGVGSGKKGVVRFIGETQFAAGEWVGIELHEPEGKNDGSVAGVRYFECADKHGLFVKRAQVKLDRDYASSKSDTKSKLEAAKRDSGIPTKSASSAPTVASRQVSEDKVESGKSKGASSVDSQRQGSKSGDDRAKLEAAMQTLQDQYSSLQAELASQRQSHEKELAIHKQKYDELSAQLENTTSELSKQQQKFQDEMAAQQQQHAAELVSLKESRLEEPASSHTSDDDLALIRQRHSDDMAAQEQQLREEISRIRQANADEIAAQQRKYEDDISALRKRLDNNDESEEIGRHKEELAALAQKHDDDLEKERKLFKEELTALEQKYGDELEKERKQFKEELAALEQKHGDDLEKERNNVQVELPALEQKHIDDLEKERKQFEEKLAALEQKHGDDLDKERKHFEEELATLGQNGDELEKERKHFKEQLAALEHKHGDDLDQERSHFKEQLAALEQKHNVDLEKERSHFKVELATLEQKYNEEVAALQKKCTELEGQQQDKSAEARILELQGQMSELMDTLEMVTLDSEQRCIDLETAEERIRELEQQLSSQQSDAPSSGDVSGDVEDYREQNIRLREALRRLQGVHLADQRAAETQAETHKAELDVLSAEVEQLRGSKEDADRLQEELKRAMEEIKDLSQQVDDSSGYADMVESLSTKNQELHTRLSAAESTVEDLEAAAELMEELDVSQRHEISSLRAEVENKDVKLAAGEKEREALVTRLNEQKNKMDKVTGMVEKLRKENKELVGRLAEGHEELREVSGRNVGEQSLRRRLYALTEQVATLQSALTLSTGRELLEKSRMTRLLLLVYPLLSRLLDGVKGWSEGTRSSLLALPSTIGRLEDDNMEGSIEGQGVADEVVVFSAEAAVSSALYSAVSAYMALAGEARVPIGADGQDGDEQALSGSLQDFCAASECAVNAARAVGVCWHVIGLLARGLSSQESTESLVWLFRELEIACSSVLKGRQGSTKMSVVGIASALERCETALLALCNGEYRCVQLRDVLVCRKQEQEGSTLSARSDLSGIGDDIKWHVSFGSSSLLLSMAGIARAIHVRALMGVEVATRDAVEAGNDPDSAEDVMRAKGEADTAEELSIHLHKVTRSFMGASSTRQSREILSLVLSSSQLDGLYGLFHDMSQVLREEKWFELKDLLPQVAAWSREVLSHSMGGHGIRLFQPILDPRTAFCWMTLGQLPDSNWSEVDIQEGSGALSENGCGWVQRSRRAGKNLAASVRLQDEVSELMGLKDKSESEAAALRAEQRALLRRVGELEELLTESSKAKAQVVSKSSSPESEKQLASLKEENKVLSEALEMMEQQVADLESQIEEKKGTMRKGGSAGSPNPLAVVTSLAASGEKSSECLQGTPDSLLRVLSSLQAESNAWRSLATHRIISSLRPLPLCGTASKIPPEDGSVEEKKDEGPVCPINDEERRTRARKLYNEVRTSRASVRIVGLSGDKLVASAALRARQKESLLKVSALKTTLMRIQRPITESITATNGALAV